MALLCLACNFPSLEIVDSLELGPDGTNDEITLQTLSCSSCDFLGVAVYEESRRGGGESWHHFGCRTTPSGFAELSRALRACPAPREPRCGCVAHEKYRAKNQLGSIDPFSYIEALEPRGPLKLPRS